MFWSITAPSLCAHSLAFAKASCILEQWTIIATVCVGGGLALGCYLLHPVKKAHDLLSADGAAVMIQTPPSKHLL